jgi:hypothetical protein
MSNGEIPLVWNVDSGGFSPECDIEVVEIGTIIFIDSEDFPECFTISTETPYQILTDAISDIFG